MFTGDIFFITRFIVIIFIATVVLLFLYTNIDNTFDLQREGFVSVCVGAVYIMGSDHIVGIYYIIHSDDNLQWLSVCCNVCVCIFFFFFYIYSTIMAIQL